MTSKSFSKLRAILTDYDYEEDNTESSALGVYNKVLEIVKPVCNVGNITDDVINEILIQFDYRTSTFQQDVDSFCSDISRMLNSILSDDKLMMAVVSILVYSKNTDIKLNKVNNLINDICSLDYVEPTDVEAEVNLMADLFKNNIIGSQTLSIDSASQMMKAVSSVSDLLGSGCVNSSSNKIWCANNCLKTPEELGIKSDLIIRLNQQVMNGDSINPNELLSAVRTLSVDANVIGLDKTGPTIYDIVNVRFCWSFWWIYNWILNTPSEEAGKQILRTVISCLLETDKSFKTEDIDILILEEMVLNALDYCINGKSYYTHIRAKNLNYKGGSRLSPENLNSQTKRLIKISKEILEALNKDSYYGQPAKPGSMYDSVLFNTNVNQGNCRDGNGSTENLYESMSASQTIELDCESSDNAVSGIKKLLGESFKLSTILDAATNDMKSRYDESVQWKT